MNVISLINMKGGVGKTTLTVNLADCLVKRHKKKVLVIDVDPQFNATQSLMSAADYVQHLKANKDTILNVFDRATKAVAATVDGIGAKSAKVLSDIEPIKIKHNLFLLPGNLELYRIEMTPGEGRENKLSKYISTCNELLKFDYVLIDTPPTPSIWMTSALIASNYYIIPTKPDPLSFTGIDLLESIINDKRENLDLQITCAGLILTMTQQNTKVFRESVEYIESSKKWKKQKFRNSIPLRTEIARNQTNKKFILDLNDNQSKVALSGFVEELIQRIEK